MELRAEPPEICELGRNAEEEGGGKPRKGKRGIPVPPCLS